MIRVDFRTEPAGPVATLVAALPHAKSVRVENAFPHPEGEWVLVLTVVDDDDDPTESAFEDDPDVTVVDVYRRGPDSEVFHLFVRFLEADAGVLETLLATEAIPDEIRIENDEVTVSATANDWEHLKRLGNAFDRAHGRFDLRSVTEVDHPNFPFGSATLTHVLEGKMSEDQLELLELAFERGYFELPRRATESDLADELGVSQSTVSERLRSAQQALLGIVLGQR